MPAFKRLTEADLRTLTREELLDRFDAEGAYWDRKMQRGLSEKDAAAYQEYGRLLHLAIDHARALDDITNYLNGGDRPDYWKQRPLL
jgi:hypothetical protein